MIMGFFSFAILIILQIEAHWASGILDPYISMFELAHVWLFGVGMTYALHAVVFSWRLRGPKRPLAPGITPISGKIAEGISFSFDLGNEARQLPPSVGHQP